MSHRQDIGQLLVENGQISEEELAEVLKQAEDITEPVGTVLLRLGLINEENLKTVLELHFGVNYLDLKKVSPDSDLIPLLPSKFVLQHDIVPVQQSGNRLTLAMVTPTDSLGLKKAKEYVKDKQINIVVCSDDGFQDFVNRAYPQKQSKQTESQSEFSKFARTRGSGKEILAESFEGAIDDNRALALLSRHIVLNAISKGCSNIHIEPNERQVLVHYRKEGILFPAKKLPKSILPELVKRFKVMAANLGDAGILPYDGLLNVRHEHKSLSFRLSIVPGAHGEHLVVWLE